MNRRSLDVSGCVNFPIHNSNLNNTEEGGMFVKLVVCDNRDDHGFGVCSGVCVNDLILEVFAGDDRHDFERDPDQTMGGEAYHYPCSNDPDTRDLLQRQLSRPYLASIVLGSTGWSGWNDEAEEYWHCTFDDLNSDGQALYRQIEALYPGCDLHLLTFLDT